MKTSIERSLVIVAVVVFAQLAAVAQVQERNVRAAMTFLAGDGMQGRGSGTPGRMLGAMTRSSTEPMTRESRGGANSTTSSPGQ